MPRHDFNKSADHPVEIQFEKWSASLSEDHQYGFRDLKCRQDTRRAALTEKLANGRADSVDAYARDFFDKNFTEASMSLRPKHIRSSTEGLKQQARVDATQRVDYEERAVIDKFDARCIEAQYNYLQMAQHSEKLGKDYRRASFDNTNDKGQSR